MTAPVLPKDQPNKKLLQIIIQLKDEKLDCEHSTKGEEGDFKKILRNTWQNKVLSLVSS
jgi:hypothetical protein